MVLENIIIIDNNSYPVGGTAQVAVMSAIELARKGFNITFVTADGKENKKLLDENINVINLKQYELKENPNRKKAAINGIWNRQVYKEMKKVLNRYNTENTIIHIHGYLHRLSPSVLKACVRSKIKVVLTLHDYFILCPCGGFYNYNKHSICTKKAMSLKCIFCNCDKRNYVNKIWRVIRQMAVKRYLTNKADINLIYISAFSFSKIKNALKCKHRAFYVRNPYDLSVENIWNAEDNYNYVFLGRLSAEKGVELFCKVFSELKKNGEISGEAIVVGDGETKNSLESEFPEIIFTGWKSHDEIPEIMEKTRALVFPSKWYEGAPLTPIEFMAHGIPCIVSDACAAVEYIEDYKDGMIFRSEDIEDLKKKVLDAENNEIWGKVSNTLRNTFDRDMYSVVSHGNRLIEVYNEILGDEY